MLSGGQLQLVEWRCFVLLHFLLGRGLRELTCLACMKFALRPLGDLVAALVWSRIYRPICCISRWVARWGCSCQGLYGLRFYAKRLKFLVAIRCSFRCYISRRLVCRREGARSNFPRRRISVVTWSLPTDFLRFSRAFTFLTSPSRILSCMTSVRPCPFRIGS